MNTFFSPEEREDLRQHSVARMLDMLSVWNLDERIKIRLMEHDGREFNQGIDYIDVSLGNTDDEDRALMSSQENRAKIVDFTKRWMDFPLINFTSAARFLYHELIMPVGDRGIEDTLQHRLDNTVETVELMSRFVPISDRFPFMFTNEQLNHLMSLEPKQISSVAPQFDFLYALSAEDIAAGKIDFQELRQINKLHTPFTSTLRTLELLEGMAPVRGMGFFPIINSNFFGAGNYDFKGIIQPIPENVLRELTAVDPRVYHFGRESIDIKNWMTCILMSDKDPKGKTSSHFISLLSEGNFIGFKLLSAQSMLQNIGYTFNIPQLEQSSQDWVIDLVNGSRKGVAELIAEKLQRSYLELTALDINKIATEVTRPGFYVGFRHMRHEQNHIREHEIAKGQNPLVLMIDPLQGTSTAMPTLGIYMACINADLVTILQEGPRRLPNGKKFYGENRAFFERRKSGQAELKEETYNMVKKIGSLMKDKEVKRFIETFLAGVDSASRGILSGDQSEGVLHYISKRFPNKIVLQEVHGTKEGNFALGYAMNNCLDILDVMRHLMNPDARIYCMWSDGQKVGMSYDIHMQSHTSTTKSHLIDSIELSDAFYTKMNSLYRIDDGQRVQQDLLVGLVVHCYLDYRLMLSEDGIYVLPESNNFHVRAAVEKYISKRKGLKMMSYEGAPVHTDTLFRKTPYWISKEVLKKSNSHTIIFDRSGHSSPASDKLIDMAIDDLRPLGLPDESLAHIRSIYKNMADI